MRQSAELDRELLRRCAVHQEEERSALPLLAGVLALAAVPSAGAAAATGWFVATIGLSAGLYALGDRMVRERSEHRVTGFIALRALQSGLWGSLALLAFDGSSPQTQLVWLFLSASLAVVFCVTAAPLPRLALARGLPLFGVALYLSTRQEMLPLLPYVAGFAPALAILVRPFRAAALRDAEARLALERAHAEAETANRELAELAVTDELTRVPNRRAFTARATQEMARARRYGHTLSVMMIDVDHFKEINDRHGHSTGDEILRTVADILVDALRETDLLARLGGDEFALLLPETPAAGARVLADRLRQAVENAQIHASAKPVPVTFSCGIASYDACDRNLEAVIERADRALYRAKRAGRNRIEVDAAPESGGAQR